MKIRTFNDFKNLRVGTLISDCTGIYEVVTPYRNFNSCIGIAEVIFEDDGSSDYRLRKENSNVTFNDIKGAEIL